MTPTVDLTDLDMWAQGVPYGEFARLRREAPVAWFAEEAPNSGFFRGGGPGCGTDLN